MYGYNLVAIYPTLEEARRVSDRLLAEGLTAADVRLTEATTGTSDTMLNANPVTDVVFSTGYSPATCRSTTAPAIPTT